MPLRDDWISAKELVRRLDTAVGGYPCELQIRLIDDGSTEPCPEWKLESDSSKAVRSVQVLRLRRNAGHQRAIAIGLAHLAAGEQDFDCVLVMDADGEDTPEGALQLIQAFDTARKNGTEKAIFAARSRRTESLVFRFFYQVYKILHRLFVGLDVRVGNFSIVPRSVVGSLAIMPELWNHYAAAFFRSGMPHTSIPIPRGYRLAGVSRMNFVSLTIHGLSALSVFSDVVGVRLLIGTILGSSAIWLAMLGFASVCALRGFQIPAWAYSVAGAVTIVLIQLITIALSFTFSMLASRVNLSFIPLRDHAVFVDGLRVVCSK